MISERMHRRRQVEDMTIDELSAISGIRSDLLHAFEAGSAIPDHKELEKLGHALGVKTEYFFRFSLDEK